METKKAACFSQHQDQNQDTKPLTASPMIWGFCAVLYVSIIIMIRISYSKLTCKFWCTYTCFVTFLNHHIEKHCNTIQLQM